MAKLRCPAGYYQHPLFLRTMAAFLLLCGIGMLAASVFVAAEFSERRYRSYALRNADVCEAPPQRPSECRWTQEFIVSGGGVP